MQVLVTLAGLGQRFQELGYEQPKPLVSVMGRPAIHYLISSFRPQWKMVFAIGEHYRNSDLEKTILEYSPQAKVVYVEHSNHGPIATVEATLPFLDTKLPVAVSYCDYAMLWNPHAFEKFVERVNADICITSYKGFHPTYFGPNTYAHMLVDEKTQAITQIQEKKLFGETIQTEWTSTGFYYFKSVHLLKQGMKLQLDKGLKHGSEYYTSLAAQALLEEKPEVLGIEQPLRIFNYEVSHFLQMGTPTDIEQVEFWFQFIVKDKKKNDFAQDSNEDRLFRYWEFFFKHLFLTS